MDRIFNSVMVSKYENYYDTKSTTIVSLEQWLLSDMYKDKVIEIRETEDSHRRAKLKAQLPCIMPSGIFETRENSGLVKHSGYVCIDLDEKDNSDIDLDEAKDILAYEFDSLYYVGLSVGGNGLFGIFRIKSPEHHFAHYAALMEELRELGLVADPSCKNPSRLRGASYDPDFYFNPDATAYEKFCVISKNPRERSGTAVRDSEEFEMNREKVKNLIVQIKQKRIDITANYKDWVAIAYALISEYGGDGRPFFQQVSSIYPYYCQMECDRMYDRCLKSEPRNTLGTFFYHCKQHGLRYKYPKTDSTTLKK